MAGGKETPRQKLIGIMYLILLALLALQVSSAIMEKFKFLDDSLQYANSTAESNNGNLEKSIEKAVADNGNKAADRAVLEKCKGVRKEATEIKTYIDKLREEIIVKTGGLEDPDDRNSMYKGAKDEGTIEDLMIGLKKAEELKKEINKYCDDLKKVTGKNDFGYIALDAKDDPRISAKSDQKKKDFGELNFTHTPMVAAMAVLSNMEAEVLKYESRALGDLAEQVGATEIKFDKILAMYRAESNTVVAGTKYKADIFLGASSSTLTPVVSAEGRSVNVKDGIGKLEFTASGGAYDKDGFAKKVWNGKITIKNKGKDTTFTVKGEYRVAKPFVDLQAASVTALYRNCGNELKLSCPPLGPDFKPTYGGSSGGEFIPGAEPGKVVVVPNTPEVKLRITSGGNFLDEKVFKVRLVPRPNIKLMNGAAEVDEKRGITGTPPSTLTVKVIPDESFLQFLPKDARYNVSEVEVIYVRGKRPMGGARTFNSGQLDIRSMLPPGGTKEGDRIVVDVKTVQRANFKNQIEKVNLGTVIKNVALN